MRSIELSAAVVRDDDGVSAGVDDGLRVFGGLVALDDDRSGPGLAQPTEVGDGDRRIG